MEVHESLFASIPEVRYVAVNDGASVTLNQRDDIEDASSNESDKYEELLVNPAILLLSKNRGQIDCGGMEYVIIKYGNFFQFIYPTTNGHVSVAIESDADLQAAVKKIIGILKL